MKITNLWNKLRILSSNILEVKVRVDVLFEGKLQKVKGGATIPSGFKKTIIMGDIKKTFEFPNADTKGTSWIEYLQK